MNENNRLARLEERARERVSPDDFQRDFCRADPVAADLIDALAESFGSSRLAKIVGPARVPKDGNPTEQAQRRLRYRLWKFVMDTGRDVPGLIVVNSHRSGVLCLCKPNGGVL